MKDTRIHLAKMLNNYSSGDGYHPTPIPGVICIKISHSDKRSKRHWRACVGIVAQGCKEIVLGEEIFRAKDGHYTVAPVNLPVISRIAGATNENPFLCILIDFDPLIVSEVESQLEKELSLEQETFQSGLFTGIASEKMLETVVRLAELFDKPEDARVVGPLIIKEIYYYLLKGSEGNAIRQFVKSGSRMHKITQAIYKLYSSLNNEVDVEALAKSAHMSRSAFFKYFKEVTSMSPIQYQKKLRLLEARKLMTIEDESAEGSAFKVGYNSASQFSREYSRMFGSSPLRDVEKIKNKKKS